MAWEYALIGSVAGILVGFLVGRVSAKKPDTELLRKDLEKTKAELATYKEEMVVHFSNSADILDKMARDYRQLYDCMAKSSSHLLANSGIQTNPFAQLPPVGSHENGAIQKTYDAPPRDYSDGSSGLFNKGLEAEEQDLPAQAR